MDRIVVAAAVVGLVAGTTRSAAAHFPHDVVAEVAVSGEGASAHIVAQYLYPGTGLLWISDDGGQSWAIRGEPAASEVLESLHATNAGVLFASDAAAAAPSRSDDGGWSWSATASPDGTPVRCAVPSPAFDQQPTVFACTSGGLFRSEDAGVSWDPVEGLPEAEVVDVAPAPEFPGDPMLIALTGEAGVWRSEDGGASWNPTALPDEGRVTAVAYSPGFAADGQVWFGNSTGAILASDDRGATWTVSVPQPDGEPLDQPIHDLVAVSGQRLLAISADHAVLCSDDAGATWGTCDAGIPTPAAQHSSFWGHYRRLERPAGGASPVALAAWEGLVLGKEAGERWAEACVLTPDYVRAVAFSPAYPADPTLWIGSYGGGVHQTRDGGESWEVIADDREHLFTERFAASPEFPDDPILFVVASRRLMRSEDGGESFRQLDTGIALVHDVVLSPAFGGDRTAFTVGTADDEGRWILSASWDGGAEWEVVWEGEAPPSAQVTSLQAAPSYDGGGTLYGTQDDPSALLRSDDDGVSWTVELALDDPAAAMAVFTGDDGEQVVAVTVAGSVWRRATSWDRVAELGAGVLSGHLVGDPGSAGASALYLALDPVGLVRSRDGGVTWEEMDVPFQGPVLDVAAPPEIDADPGLIASTHYGTFFSCDDGASWHLLGRELRLEDRSCPLRYGGSGWQRIDEGTGDSASRSSAPGDVLEVSFHGRGVRWLASRFGGGGTARVFVDGASVGQVDLASAADEPTSAVFSHEFGDDGPHMLRIEVVGGGAVEVDAIEVVRHHLDNGPDEAYDIAPWCVELGEPSGDIVITAACCPDTSCDLSGGRYDGLAAWTLLWVWWIRRRAS